MQEHETHGSSAQKVNTPEGSQVVGRVKHSMTGDPVSVVLTAAGLSLPDGAQLYDHQAAEDLIGLIRSDAFAMSFQSVRQYREAILKGVRTAQEALNGKPVACYALYDDTGGPKWIKKHADGCLAFFDDEGTAGRAMKDTPGTSYMRMDCYPVQEPSCDSQ